MDNVQRPPYRVTKWLPKLGSEQFHVLGRLQLRTLQTRAIESEILRWWRTIMRISLFSVQAAKKSHERSMSHQGSTKCNEDSCSPSDQRRWRQSQSNRVLRPMWPRCSLMRRSDSNVRRWASRPSRQWSLPYPQLQQRGDGTVGGEHRIANEQR